MKNTVITDTILNRYTSFKNPKLVGRYITYKDIKPELEKLSGQFQIEKIGSSFLEVPVHSVTFGNGPVRILAWSQMHGNESTTTKAVFDLFNLFGSEDAEKELKSILENCTIKVIPMLNPDGAVRYTRSNVNEVDLNRDASELKEKESRILRSCYDSFKPHFCLNLHDQRTIFSAGDTNKPATLSFLAPAMEETRGISGNRVVAMQLIAGINDQMQPYLPGQIGRYDDAFNLQCTGDRFQALGVPTILFEAGHYQNDYLREKSREFMALAILSAFLNISGNKYVNFGPEDYAQIPENHKNFFDVILRNAMVEEEIVDIAIQFVEQIRSGKIYFEPVIQKIAPDLAFFGHQEIDCKGDKIENTSQKEINENAVVNEIMLKSDKLSIKIAETI